MARDQTKAIHYIQLLDDARCAGTWDQVPELVRKVRKHAPQRNCLTITAEAEHAVWQASRARPSTARPSTARSSLNPSTDGPPVTQYIPALLDAIDKARQYTEDEFHARVCLGWIHWQLKEPSLAVARLPASIESDFAELEGTNKESAGWTKVCAVKALYLKGSAQAKTGAGAEALETFESGLPVLASILPTQKSGQELRLWSELYLTAICMTSSRAIETGTTPLLETETLSAFRAWAKFWDGPNSQGGRSPEAGIMRRDVWREYYFTLSNLLQQDLPFPTTALTTAYRETSSRLQQRAELKRAETIYETLLLKEVQFPDANSSSDEVEAFVCVVMHNWRMLCGSNWDEEDLGQSGSEAVTREVLDILYRAATKTFHSTAILRYLFTVHLAVADFDLAFKAFDTYLEIVKKGKARVAKTGEQEQGLDDDGTVLETASECMKALCRYDTREGAEKANDLGRFFEEWLDKHYPDTHKGENEASLENGNSNNHATTISPQIFAKAWRCIGISHAQWARMTYDAASRSDIQLQAIRCFRKALSPAYQCSRDVETLFALGMLLAERRELAAAIEVVKAGLLSQPAVQSSSKVLNPHQTKFSRERSLIPLWHLMALLLSARQEFLTAARSCEGAFEQFQHPKNLFGDMDLSLLYRSEHLNEKSANRRKGVVDQMDDVEKDNVLEVKMTQLSLVEVLEGPDVAVNASDELLSLYKRLFGDPQKEAAASAQPKTAVTGPPKSSSGTIRSVKGSLFGRSSRSVRKTNTMSSVAEDNSASIRPRTAQTVGSMNAPTIHVTNENGGTARQQFQPSPKDQHHHHEKLQERSVSVTRSASSRTRSTSRPRSRSADGAVVDRVPTEVDGELFFTPPVDSQHRDRWLYDGSSDRVGLAVSPEPGDNAPRIGSRQSDIQKPLPRTSQQMPQNETTLQSRPLDDRLPQISPYSSCTSPVTRFPLEQQRRLRISILVKVWLLIAGFYRRASMYDDAKGAIDEAQKLTRVIEASVARDSTGDVSTSKAGWGGGKSVSELYSDLFSERGYLAAAESLPHLALSHFEAALMQSLDHPAAIVGLSTILLDIYAGKLSSPPLIPPLIIPGQPNTASASHVNATTTSSTVRASTIGNPSLIPSSTLPTVLHGPLGLPSSPPFNSTTNANVNALPEPSFHPSSSTKEITHDSRSPSHDSTISLSHLDRLAARDRAYGLLSELTKLGSGWNYSEAWFALARAYEEGGQLEKAREVLWWCVELEEGRGVRRWGVVGSGGYVL